MTPRGRMVVGFVSTALTWSPGLFQGQQVFAERTRSLIPTGATQHSGESGRPRPCACSLTLRGSQLDQWLPRGPGVSRRSGPRAAVLFPSWPPAPHLVALALSLVELTEEILKLLMELVFRLVCSGELSLARVLRKNILDKVDQKRLLRCANSDQPLAARGVAAR